MHLSDDAVNIALKEESILKVFEGEGRRTKHG